MYVNARAIIERETATGTEIVLQASQDGYSSIKSPSRCKKIQPNSVGSTVWESSSTYAHAVCSHRGIQVGALYHALLQRVPFSLGGEYRSWRIVKSGSNVVN